jgi:hypothetical protein
LSLNNVCVGRGVKCANAPALPVNDPNAIIFNFNFYYFLVFTPNLEVPPDLIALNDIPEVGLTFS